MVHSSGAFAASLPYVLYSDLYDHREFVRGVAVCGFSGLLWTPEVRHAVSREDPLRRIQAVVLSPQALINAWYIKNPPWLQFERGKNNADELLDDAPQLEAAVRELFRLRMSLLPYLYAVFARYYCEGIPPFRALALDYPADTTAQNIDDEYLMGEDLLVAPIFCGQQERKVYLPPGDWYDFRTHAHYVSGETHIIPVSLDTVLIFVREGTILPLADPVEHVTPETVFEVTPHAYGPAAQLRPAMLWEDAGVSLDFRSGEFNRVVIQPGRSVTRSGSFDRHRYRIRGWVEVPVVQPQEMPKGTNPVRWRYLVLGSQLPWHSDRPVWGPWYADPRGSVEAGGYWEAAAGGNQGDHDKADAKLARFPGRPGECWPPYRSWLPGALLSGFF